MNEQEKFWAGKFGDEYINRSSQKTLINNNFKMFNKILKREKKNIKSLIEFGPNIGNNIFALRKIITKLKTITAVEINKKACKKEKFHNQKKQKKKKIENLNSLSLFKLNKLKLSK